MMVSGTGFLSAGFGESADHDRQMKLVLQHPHGSACQQACIAMLADRTIEQVIADAGTDGKIDITIRSRLYRLYGLTIPDESFAIAPFETNPRSLTWLMQNHTTLLCSLYDWKDIHYAHAIIIHNGDLYDPWHGMNPTWPWHRVIGQATPIELSK
jgi:hypothetical protein